MALSTSRAYRVSRLGGDWGWVTLGAADIQSAARFYVESMFGHENEVSVLVEASNGSVYVVVVRARITRKYETSEPLEMKEC